MSKGKINSITLDKTVILKDETASITVDYEASGSDVFTLDDFVDSSNMESFTSGIWAQQQQIKMLEAEYGDVRRGGDRFGRSVAIDGNYAIVGSDMVGGNTSLGAAYIFKRDGTSWAQQEKLMPDDDQTYQSFGSSVDIDGDYAIVGAWGDDQSLGTAYIFYKHQFGTDSWGEQAQLKANSRYSTDRFGDSVAISGNYAIVGAWYDNDYRGAAYIFKRDDSSWTQQAKLVADERERWDSFGFSVAISGDYAIVGAKYAENYAGEAYIFYKDQGGTDNWGQQKKLTASDTTTGDKFGGSVAINGNYAIVGSEDEDGARGSAYIFKRDNSIWTQKAKLTASDKAAFDLFGWSVDISGDYAIVGSVEDDNDKGSAYIFKKSGETWTQQKKLTASDGAAGDKFGSSVAISGDYAIVGAWEDDNRRGSAYIFKSPGIVFTPPDNTVSIKKLGIKTDNWSGVTESNYILINNYTDVSGTVMDTAYNEYIRIKDESYSLGSDYGYSTGFDAGYTPSYTSGSGVGYAAGLDDGYATGSGVGYTNGYATGSADGYTNGYATGSGVGFNAGVESVAIQSITITVHEGWNIFNSVISGNITDSSNVIIAESLHRFNGTAYEKIPINNIIEASKGYIVKCEKSGVFTINLSEN